MKESRIAVISKKWKDFDDFICRKYQELSNDKSMVISMQRNQITIEHPKGVGYKYVCIDSVDRLDDKYFNDFEQTESAQLNSQFEKILEAVQLRTHPL